MNQKAQGQKLMKYPRPGRVLIRRFCGEKNKPLKKGSLRSSKCEFAGEQALYPCAQLTMVTLKNEVKGVC